MNCQVDHCEYICDTPFGSYCTLTNEPVETTRCHYEQQKELEEMGMCEEPTQTNYDQIRMRYHCSYAEAVKVTNLADHITQTGEELAEILKSQDKMKLEQYLIRYFKSQPKVAAQKKQMNKEKNMEVAKYTVIRTNAYNKKVCLTTSTSFEKAIDFLKRTVSEWEKEQEDQNAIPLVQWRNNGTIAYLNSRVGGFCGTLEVVVMGEASDSVSKTDDMGLWEMVDRNSFQVRREVEKGVFELYQVQFIPTPDETDCYGIAHAVIDTNKDNMQNVWDNYDPHALHELREVLGDGANKFFARYSFEIDASDLKNLVSEELMTFEEACKQIREKMFAVVPESSFDASNQKNLISEEPIALEAACKQIHEMMFASVPETDFPTPWVLTDDDSFQLRREVENGVFELYQVQIVPMPGRNEEEHYGIAHEIVDVKYIDTDDILSCYGYESLDEVKATYEDEANAILAECSFELDASSLKNLVNDVPMTFEKACEQIRKMADYHEPEQADVKEPEKPKELRIQTTAGELIAYPLTDPGRPGIALMWKPNGADCEIDVACAEVREDQEEPDYDPDRVHVALWEDVTTEDYTKKFILDKREALEALGE